MLHLYHIPGVRIEASKDHRAINVASTLSFGAATKSTP